jgi:hypothetical protein
MKIKDVSKKRLIELGGEGGVNQIISSPVKNPDR